MLHLQKVGFLIMGYLHHLAYIILNILGIVNMLSVLFFIG